MYYQNTHSPQKDKKVEDIQRMLNRARLMAYKIIEDERNWPKKISGKYDITYIQHCICRRTIMHRDCVPFGWQELSIDGYYWDGTEKAVRCFQNFLFITENGIMGDTTYRLLLEFLSHSENLLSILYKPSIIQPTLNKSINSKDFNDLMNSINTTGKATTNKKIFISMLLEYSSAIGLEGKVGFAVILGQVAVESGCFKYMEEIGKGKGKQYGIPRDSSGNINSECGKIYYGRGPIQVTWYSNYKQIYNNFFVPNGLGQYNVVKDPDLASDPYIGSLLSIGWFTLPGNGKSAISAANKGNVTSCRKRINGGTNGLKQCKEITKEIAKSLNVVVNLEG